MSAPDGRTPQLAVGVECERYRFGEFELDALELELSHRGHMLRLTSKSAQVLVRLVRNRCRPVSRRELQETVWPETKVAPGSINQAIYEIRAAMSKQLTDAPSIETIRGHGYRFIAEVERLPSRFNGDFDHSLQLHSVLRRLNMLPVEARSMVVDLAMWLARRSDCECIGVNIK